MRARFLLPLALLLGCSSGNFGHRALTAEQAETLARTLANEKALTLYNCKPFTARAAATREPDGWTWHDRKGWGSGDFEATVKFAADGGNADVKVHRLYDQIR